MLFRSGSLRRCSFSSSIVANRFDLGRERVDDAEQPLGIEDRRSLGERTERGLSAAEPSLNALELTGLLNSSERTDCGIEEEKEDEQAVLIKMQASVARLVTLTIDIVELPKQRHEPLKVF